jgi:membrane fusion protein (multidrug efflux system)
VTVLAGAAQELPLVPAAVVQQDQDGAYVFVLDKDNRAVIRRVTLGQREGVNWAATSGLVEGETIVVSGIQKIHAGMVVTPKPVSTAGN